MADVSQNWGADISFSGIGDIATSSGTTLGQQRVIRRLLTPPGSYIWHPTYGAGLPQMIGSLASNAAIIARVRGQMLLESAVSQSPPPVVTVTRPQVSVVQISISYNDASVGSPVELSFNIAK